MSLRARSRIRGFFFPLLVGPIVIAALSPVSVRAAGFNNAVRMGNVTTVDALLKENPGLIAIQDRRGNYPLHVAAGELHMEVVKRLMDAGADVNARGQDGTNPLHSVILSLRPGKNMSVKRRAMIELLLSKGANVRSSDDQGLSVLHLAAVKGRMIMLDMLLAAGADVSARDALGRTPLHLAALHNRNTMIGWLLAKGTNVKARDGRGDTALHSAVRRFRLEATKALLTGKAVVDARNEDGQTPLHIAAWEGPDAVEVDRMLTPIAEMLIDAGADPKIRDKAGMTPLDLATKKRRTNLIALLRRQ